MAHIASQGRVIRLRDKGDGRGVGNGDGRLGKANGAAGSNLLIGIA